ncbi:MAG: ATP-binding protein [Nanoarchaeota archaeon]
MKFIDRTEEMRYLKEAAGLSKSKLFTVSITGLRRVGKTRLILELLSKDDLYFFVNKDKESTSLLQEYADILRARKIITELEVLNSWDTFFKILLERFKGIIVFDEFQNFMAVDKSVYGILQKHIDLNENKGGLFIIFSGSTVGLMKKLFSDSKQPLYGRLKRKMPLKPLMFRDTLEVCNTLGIHSIEEAVRLYAIFGGFPKYYVAIEDEQLGDASFEKIMDRLFFAENAVLEDEASQILSLEFGKRSGIYYDILAAIASGNTRISEVASVLRKKETTLTRQLNELINRFEIVSVEKPVTGGKSIFVINHPLLNFWFRFFYKNLSSYKRREGWLVNKVKNNTNAYVGLRFEEVCREFLLSQKLNFEKTSRWWGAYRENEERKVAEIDIVSINEQTKEILFCECKWQDKVDAKKVLTELKDKTKFVNWNREKRKEQYAIFAKSFKERFKEPNLLLFDLTDLEKLL